MQRATAIQFLGALKVTTNISVPQLRPSDVYKYPHTSNRNNGKTE